MGLACFRGFLGFSGFLDLAVTFQSLSSTTLIFRILRRIGLDRLIPRDRDNPQVLLPCYQINLTLK